MNEEEAINQIHDLIKDRESFITKDEESNDVFRKDIKALKWILNSYEHDKICLEGYRESILKKSLDVDMVENILLENKSLKTKEESLIKYLEEFISKTYYEVILKGNHLYLAWSNAYNDLLEKVKSGKYE